MTTNETYHTRVKGFFIGEGRNGEVTTTSPALSKRELATLGELRHFTDQGVKHEWHRKWARPLDVGGSNGSHHGATLMKLGRLGLAEVQKWRIGSRHTYYYKISQAGRDMLATLSPTEASPDA